MIVVTGGRQSGKTTACLRWMVERPGGRTLLVSGEDRRRDVVRALTTFMPQFAHWEQYVVNVARLGDHRRGRFMTGEFGIDDLDTVLEALFQGRVGFVTMNATEIPLGPGRRYETETVMGQPFIVSDE